ncbi:T9SS type A sorting domain-containing protein [Gilvibacter sp.]|uniref:T9SS type A sorting domain-containing protein n=1 Tax=Gilvibacter sp. TaxID=2729997 RepID=UPI003F4A5668
MKKKTLHLLVLLLVSLMTNLQAQVVINEIYPDGTLELKNTGTETVDISNYWLCDRPTYTRVGTLDVVSGDLNLAPGDLIIFENWDFLNPVGDELALYNSAAFGSATAILDYVQWGSNPGEPSRESVAVAAGIWTAGAFTPAITSGNSLQYDGMGEMASDFFLATPTLGAENALPMGEIVINEVFPNGTIELKNIGDAAVDVTNYWLCDRPTYARVGALTIGSGDLNIAPGDFLIIEDWDFLNAPADELALYETNAFGSADAILDYVQWGENPGDPTREGVAVAAGIWTAGAFTDPITDGNSLQYDGEGNAVTDYYVALPTIGAENSDCSVNAAEIVFDVATTGNPNNTTSFSDDGLTAVICVDSRPDPLFVTTLPGGVGTNRGWIITDAATDQILAVTDMGPFNLDPAGPGDCQIWYVRYETISGNEVGNNLSDLEGCFDLSNPLTVVRQEADGGTIAIDVAATGNPNNTTTISDDGLSAVICVDGRPDPLVVVHENPGAESLSYRYVITANDPERTILAISGSSEISLDGAGPGTCLIWGWSYRGVPENGAAFIGGPLADLDAESCSDISDNAIEVIREEADGGTVAIDIAATGNPNNTTTISDDGLSAVICVDGRPDPLVVVHENPGAENLSYRYVITANDADQTILAISGSSEISLDGAGPGTCLIWGWSYRGVPDNGAAFIGGPLADLDAESCSDISDNAIEVIREEADGGTVSLENGDTEVSICAGDDIPDPLVVIHENPGAENLSYRYVITDSDADNTILGISGSSTIDLEGAGEGVCRIWGWSYRGVPDNGAAFIGGPLADLNAESCSDISDNFVTVNRLTGDDCEVLSVDEQDFDANISLFPNPAQNQMNISLGGQSSTAVEVRVFNISGQEVIAPQQMRGTSLSVDISALSSGMYLVQLQDNDTGVISTKRLIKQ